MAQWKQFVLAGIALPVAGLLLIDTWYPYGIMYNVLNSWVSFSIGNSIFGIKYKWIVLVGLGLVIYGIVKRERVQK